MRSELALPLPLAESHGEVETIVRKAGHGALPGPAELSAWELIHPEAHAWRAAAPDGGSFVRLHYGNSTYLVEFVIGPAGRDVWVRWTDGLPVENVAALFLGPVFPCVVKLLGLTALHGSVVAVDGRATVIIGASGSGKSTTALACIRNGATLIADDLAILDEVPNGFAVRPGLPSMRLRPATAETLTGGFDSLRALWTVTDTVQQKRWFDLPPLAADAPTHFPLNAIVVLGRRLDPATEPHFVSLAGATALAELMARRSAEMILDRWHHLRDIAMLGKVASAVPIRALRRPEGLDRIDEIAEMVLRGAAVATGAPSS